MIGDHGGVGNGQPAPPFLTEATTEPMTAPETQEAPLFSNRSLRIMIVAAALFVALMVAISLAGRWIGERISLAGHTASTDILTVEIGRDSLRLPANTIRFPQARHDGEAERIDLYLTWPEMTGYTAENGARFNDLARPGQLVFLQITQSTMSRDMSGRLELIYRGLFEGAASDYEAELKLHRLRQDSGYHAEVMLTGARPGKPDYAVRCILPSQERPASNADCQRDIAAGSDLSVLYRFSSTLLPQWQALDEAVLAYVQARLAPSAPQPENP